jgi:predicted nucleic acid-binding protein
VTYFVDTNILVYARDAAEPIKQKQALAWLERLWEEHSGRTSYQVLQEYYVTVTRKFSPGLSITDARDDVRALQTWNPCVIEKNVVDGAWSIQDRYQFSWWDSLIVSAAQVIGCQILLTEDLQHDQKIDELTIINPFASLDH